MQKHRLRQAGQVEVKMPRPFDFDLTVHKPAGWSWSTPGEIYADGTIWAGLHLNGVPVGARLSAKGAKVNATFFAPAPLGDAELALLTAEVEAGLGKDLDLAAFYDFGWRDAILAKTIEDLHGMRTGSFEDIFGRVILAICLQMAQLRRAMQMMAALLETYGDRLLFDGREVATWPSPAQLAAV
ncbi:MAG: DNA glycosylase family protein, partial [Candidatus Geothermincolia bacterium]